LFCIVKASGTFFPLNQSTDKGNSNGENVNNNNNNVKNNDPMDLSSLNGPSDSNATG